jgi:RNA polymerase sigma factor (sigma-70 family)
MTDLDLIAAAKSGDQAAFAELYRIALPWVRATARSVLKRTDVEDVCQEVFLEIFVKPGLRRYHQDKSSLRTWVTRVTLSRCLMTLRRYSQPTNGDCNLVSLTSLDSVSI